MDIIVATRRTFLDPGQLAAAASAATPAMEFALMRFIVSRAATAIPSMIRVEVSTQLPQQPQLGSLADQITFRRALLWPWEAQVLPSFEEALNFERRAPRLIQINAALHLLPKLDLLRFLQL